MPKLRPHPKFDGVFTSNTEKGQFIYTKNLDVGRTIYGERIVYEKDIQYREWNPFRSKLAAVIMKKARNIYVNRNTRCLYLGASSGTTISSISDIAYEGIIFGVEFSARSIRELVQSCEFRKNIIPIMGDANLPESYAKFLFGEIDLVYCDVAQPNQTDIAILNCKYFLKTGGILIMAIKARSIDVSLDPQSVFKKEISKFQDANFDILEDLDIAPYTQDHRIVIARYLGE